MSASPPSPPRALDAAAATALPPGVAVLDARNEVAFARGHLAGAGRLTLAEFAPRRAELPPRDTPVLVVHDDPAEARATAEALSAMGYAQADWLDDSLAALPGGLADRGPAARLWRPSPFLARMLDRLPAGDALDLAAGSGRESVFLALHGWNVEAWDRAPEALERARALAARNGVALATHEVNLEWRGLPPPARTWSVIVVCRFLHRPLFPWIEQALAPGGALVYETFRVGQERFGRPTHERFLLRAGELSSAFPSLSVELHEEPDRPEGPLMSRLLARRPA